MGPKGSLRKINKFLELKSNENKNIKMYGKEKEGRKEGGDEGKTKGRKEGKSKKGLSYQRKTKETKYKPNYTEDPRIPVVSLSFKALKNKAKAYFYEHIYVQF